MNAAPSPKEPSDPATRLDRLASWAGWVLLWERVWPPLAWAGAATALFLAVSWFGFWFAAPHWLRLAALAAFAAALGFALYPLARLRSPGRAERLARLDRDSGARHGAAAGFEDSLANGHGDAATETLWSLHRARLAQQIARLNLAPPEPRMAWRDPRAFRFAALLLALAGGLFAGSERYARVAAAFDWRLAAATSAPPRIDAWIDPPGYAGKPPILLTIARREPPELITAPEDSVLVMRSEAEGVEGRPEGGVAAAAPAAGKTPAPSPEKRFVLHSDGKFSILSGGATLAEFSLHVIPITRPTIALIDPPQANLSGSLTLHYSVNDAYGVSGARADFALPGETGAKHRLAEPPTFPLSLPGGARGTGEARTTSDLAENGWAGADVQMTLRATDLAGRTGESAPIALKLPQRNFTKPLAKALVEQRRNLILDPDANQSRLATALDALMLAPDVFGTSPSVYLGLREVKSDLAAAHGDKDLLNVAALMWAMALQIEDGDASQALRDLRAAEQKLRDALKRGASEAEIKALTQQLRETAQRYLNDLAKQDPSADSQDQTADAQDLDQMMNKLDEAARNGAKDDAQAMLDQLQDMLENMRNGGDPQQQAVEREMQRQMNELNKLLHDQQALRDDTFKRDQKQKQRHKSPSAQPSFPMNPDEAAPNDGQDQEDADQNDDSDNAQQPGQPTLEQRQKALRDRLAELQKRLKQMGAKGEKGLDDAQGDMSEAEQDLNGRAPGQGDNPGDGQQPGQGGAKGKGKGKGGQLGAAVDAQGRALEALRNGMQGLQKQAQGQGQGQGQGKGGNRAVGRRNGTQMGRDPFGRGEDGRGVSEGSLNEGQAPAERARRVLQELRRRLADPNRPGQERDYLERLLGEDPQR